MTPRFLNLFFKMMSHDCCSNPLTIFLLSVNCVFLRGIRLFIQKSHWPTFPLLLIILWRKQSPFYDWICDVFKCKCHCWLVYLTLVPAGGAAWEVVEALGGRTFGGSGTLNGLEAFIAQPCLLSCCFLIYKLWASDLMLLPQAHEPLPQLCHVLTSRMDCKLSNQEPE